MGYSVSKSCGNCGASVPSSTSVGDRCPSCGARFGSETTRFVGGGGGGGAGDFDPKAVLIGCGVFAVLIAAGVGIYLWRQSAGRNPDPPAQAPVEDVRAVAISPDGRRAANLDGTFVRVWDVGSRAEQRTLTAV